MDNYKQAPDAPDQPEIDVAANRLERTDQTDQTERTEKQTNKAQSDLIVLRYMAQKVRVMLHSPDRACGAVTPSLYFLEERQRRAHRIAIYDTQALLQNVDLSFVGFVSGKQRGIDPFVEEELERADKIMLTELARIPGLLAYSSMELRTRTWYNLVLMSSFDAKAHLRNVQTHQYASYQLAPHYYEWIRLHNGSIAGGLASHALLLRSTKYYSFQNKRPTVRELVY